MTTDKEQLAKFGEFEMARKANLCALYEGLSAYDEYLLRPRWDGRADVCWFARVRIHRR